MNETKTTNANKAASMRYCAKNVKQVKFNFNRVYDADIIEHLENQDNMQGYVKQLIRDDIKEGGGNNEHS